MATDFRALLEDTSETVKRPKALPECWLVGKIGTHSFGNTNTENYMVLRLAEQYLIRAEARAEQGEIPGARADLDTIRSRAGLPPTIANSTNSLLSAIHQESRVEFFAEWGHRWFDLKRSGLAMAILGTEKPEWQGTDTLYPLPLSQLQSNTFLTQNPGY